MTRRDFQLIADALRTIPPDVVSRDGQKVLAQHFASVLATTNDRFDATRFLRACGHPSDDAKV